MESLSSVTAPGGKRIAVRVKPAAERALRGGHPWLFDDSIRRLSHDGAPGDLAVIFDARDRFLAIGLYDPDSPIRVRILHQGEPATIDSRWFADRLRHAFARRASLDNAKTTGYRLVHGENDGLPGLVLDRYGNSGVVRLDTAAWLPHLNSVLTEALALEPLERLVLRLSRRVKSNQARLHGLQDGQLLMGKLASQPITFYENGLRFEANLVRGQKTGFFLDQRDNRAKVEQLVSQDQSLRRVLNTFSYTGGFSVYAARAGAMRLTNVDASQIALSAAERNLNLNRQQWAAPDIDHEMICGDAFDILDGLSRAERRFDVVVIDPPAFAISSGQVGRAMGAYRRLAKLGVALLRPQGLLVMSSCSSRIDADDFFRLVNHAVDQARRTPLEVARTGHPLDHPIGFPEGAYLKCMFARVG